MSPLVAVLVMGTGEMLETESTTVLGLIVREGDGEEADEEDEDVFSETGLVSREDLVYTRPLELTLLRLRPVTV